ncbi:PREDICTED: carbonic anhydrase-related protein [Nipponia nippon]|nr:PREDICTED: carbonic anhydrase-related protein [Nipponia nippon]
MVRRDSCPVFEREAGCMELCHEAAESLWVWAGRQTDVDDIGVGVCYRLPDQVIEEMKRGDALQDLMFTNKEELVGNVKVRGSPGHLDHEMDPDVQTDSKDLLAPDSGEDGGCFAAPHQLQSLGAGLSHPQERCSSPLTIFVTLRWTLSSMPMSVWYWVAQTWTQHPGVEWGLIFPDANGEYQSPINLNSREAKYDPSLLEVRLSPNYVVCRDCEVINDGHSIQIALKSKSVLIGGPLPRGHEFELHDVRFHWGRENQRGSEHTVNFKAFPMELHLMHWNSTLYSSIDEAVGKKHGIAIIALFVQIGKEHVGLKAVTEILQDIQYKGKSKTIPCFNPNSLLPDPLLRDYWVYEGSLTIPPCSEGVTWILFRYPLTVSQVQIEEFRRLRTHVKGAELLEGCDGILGDNFRPTQPLSDRVIRAAFQ